MKYLNRSLAVAARFGVPLRWDFRHSPAFNESITSVKAETGAAPPASERTETVCGLFFRWQDC